MKVSDAEVARKLINIKQSAEARDIVFDLSFHTVKRLMTVKTCYFTKVKFGSVIGADDERTFDRLDNDKGYIEKNVVAAAKGINSKKSNLSIKEIKDIYNGIKHLL